MTSVVIVMLITAAGMFARALWDEHHAYVVAYYPTPADSTLPTMPD